ncbi:54S ribosomal protein L2, mitochondrial [Clarias magur]|uniref:54S ribosomal protein L2, mitochondrial n=1 Tax=Clarias magur TaxID=1594786 RepID=A0A8J4XG67_CLAMG|nr:54S ribosomal protein L2, mitochondrial [Clarias magur]
MERDEAQRLPKSLMAQNAGISPLHPLARATAVAMRNDCNIPVPQQEFTYGTGKDHL